MSSSLEIHNSQNKKYLARFVIYIYILYNVDIKEKFVKRCPIALSSLFFLVKTTLSRSYIIHILHKAISPDDSVFTGIIPFKQLIYTSLGSCFSSHNFCHKCEAMQSGRKHHLQPTEAVLKQNKTVWNSEHFTETKKSHFRAKMFPKCTANASPEINTLGPMIWNYTELLYGTILVKIHLFSSRFKVFAAMTICHQILHTSIRLHVYETANLKTPIFKHVYYRQLLSHSVRLRSNMHFPSATLETWSLTCHFIFLETIITRDNNWFSLFVQCRCWIQTNILILNITRTLLPCLVFCSHFLPMVVLPYWWLQSVHLSITIQRDRVLLDGMLPG